MFGNRSDRHNGCHRGCGHRRGRWVLPGVSVEAASPALIEKVRTVVTDSQGQYKIVDLRPGIYSATFTLTGFATFKKSALREQFQGHYRVHP